jgi:hypothetical protein
MKNLVIIIVLLASVFFTGCYRDNETDLYPVNGSCETSGVTYATTVVPILQSNGCMSCHSGGAPSGNISLEGYVNVRSAAINGKLYGTINHSAGYSPMPQGGNKMSNCNINKIKAWIDSGSINN